MSYLIRKDLVKVKNLIIENCHVFVRQMTVQRSYATDFSAHSLVILLLELDFYQNAG